MDAARFALLTSALGMTDGYLEQRFQVARRAARRWRRGITPVPDEIARFVEARWQGALMAAEQALEAIEGIEDETGAPPQAIDLSLYVSDESAERAGIAESARDHTARAALVAFILELEGYRVQARYVPEEGGADA